MQKENKYETRLATEAMLPLIFKMALPAIAAQIVNLLYNIVDRIYIGHIPEIGTQALAGVGLTTSITILITAFAAIVGSGAAPLASISLGQGDRRQTEQILGNGFTLLMIFGVAILLITYLFMEPILRMAGASPETMPFAVDYLQVYLFGTFFVLISTGLNSFINVQGRPSIAMWSIVIGAIINIILDPIFIFVLGMGVKGAALATVLSVLCSSLWILRFLTSDKASLQLKRNRLKLQAPIAKSIIGLGLSPFVMTSTESLISFVLNGTLSLYGDIYVSSLAIMQSAALLTSTPLVGFAQGFVPIASYNFGHGNAARVKSCFKIALLFMFSFNCIFTLAMILFPAETASLFTDDPELIATVDRYMPLFLAGMTIFGLQRACQNMFVALGQAKISIFIAFLRKIFLLIPLALILHRYMGVQGVYAAEAISDATAAICCTWIFFTIFPKLLQKMKSQATEQG